MPRAGVVTYSPSRLASSTSGASMPLPISRPTIDRKSTRLNSSHSQISYAVFCLKKNKFSDTAPNVAAEMHSGDVLHINRRSVLHFEDNAFDVLDFFYVAASAYEILSRRNL